MFNRLSRSIQVCFGYQRRIVSQTEAWSVKARQGTFTRRLYNVATAPIEAEQHDNDNDAHHIDTAKSSESLGRIAKRRRFRDRKWRPHPTAQLGVESLGQPAEVLILPTRDRKISQTPVNDEEPDEPQLRVQESLDSELKPVTLDQAKQNIDAVKAEMFSDDKEIDDQDWIKARMCLHKGFSRGQLQYYVDSAGSQGKPITKLKANKSKSRQLLALKIMTQIWGLPPPTTDIGPRVVSTKRWKVSRKFVDLMLFAGKDVLRHLSKRLDVKIDLFRTGGFIRFSGVSDAAPKAKSELMALRNQMVTISIKLPENAEHIVSQRLDELARQYGVLLQKGDKSLEVTALGSDKTSAFKARFTQEISDKLGSSEKIYVLSSDTTLRRVPVDFVPDITQQTKFRYIAAASNKVHLRYVDLVDTEQKRLSSTLDEIVLDLSKQRQPVEPPPSLVEIDQEVKYVISFGQALLQESEDYDPRQEFSKPSWSKPVMSEPDIPFLSEFLAQKQLVIPNHAPPNGKSPEESCVFRVRLVPEDTTSGQPSFELIVAGKDILLGLDQKLLLQSVFVCLDSRAVHVLLPEHELDLKITKDTKIKVYEHGEKPRGISKTFHVQFNKYLAVDDRHSSKELAPTVELSTYSLFKTRQTSSLKSSKRDDNAKIPPNRNVSRLKHVRYVLESVEAVDQTVYSISYGESQFHLTQACFTSQRNGLEQPVRRTLKLSAANLQLADRLPVDARGKTSKVSTEPSQPIDVSTELSPIKSLLVAAYDTALELSLNSRSRAGQ